MYIRWLVGSGYSYSKIEGLFRLTREKVALIFTTHRNSFKLFFEQATIFAVGAILICHFTPRQIFPLTPVGFASGFICGSLISLISGVLEKLQVLDNRERVSPHNAPLVQSKR